MKTSTSTPAPPPSDAHLVDRWRAAILPEDATIQAAILNLDHSGLQIVLVVGPHDRLVGTLTDGDIRRGLLRGLELKSAVTAIVNQEPFVVPPEVTRDTALQLMQANKIHQLPVVSSERRVLGLHLWNDLVAPPHRENPMVIMAGGRGTRLKPHTDNCPKPLLAVAGKPMLQHIIERGRSQGFQRFVIAIHHLGHMIEEFFRDGSALGVQIEYLREESPLGTAGALSLLRPRPNTPFVVSNGDVLTDIHYGELLDFHSRHGACATMAVRLHEWQHPFGVVRINGVDIVGFEEKPIARNHVNAGVYVLEPRSLELLANEQCDMPTLFTRLQERGERIIVYPMHEPWLDVGRAGDLELATARKSAS